MGRLEVVHALLAAGADKEAKDKVGGGGYWVGVCVVQELMTLLLACARTRGQDGPDDGLEGGSPRGDAGAQGSRGRALVPGTLG